MTRATSLAALAVAAALLGGFVAWWLQTSGRAPLPLPATSAVVLLAMAVIVLVLGWPVRRWTRGDRNHVLDPLRAARTVALAKAAAYGGAIFLGWYFGVGFGLVNSLSIDVRRERFELAMITAVAALALCAAGLVVERWCRRPPDSDEDVEQPGQSAAS